MEIKNGLLHYIEKYRFNSIFFKTFIVALIISISLSGIFSVYIYSNSRKALENDMHYMNRESLVRIKNIVDNTINTMEKLAINLSMQSEVRAFVLASHKEVELETLLLKSLKNYTLIYQYIDSIYLFSNQSSFVISNDGSNTAQSALITQFSDAGWYNKYISAEKKTVISTRKKNESYPFLVSIIRPISFDGHNRAGAIVINLNIEELNEILKDDLTEDTMQSLLMLSDDGMILHHKNQNLIFTQLSESDELKDLNGLQSNFEGKVRLGSGQALISSVSSRYSDWKYVSYIPFENFSNQMKSTVSHIIIVCSLLFLFAFAISFWIALRAYQPIKSILTFIDDTDATKQIKRNLSLNEVDYIHTMLKTKGNSPKQNLEQQFISNNKAQMSALHSQIKSHFLYNMLATIQWKAIDLTGDENEVSNMIYKLGELFKISIDINLCIVQMEEEIRNAKLYVELLEYRYDNVFYVEWDIDDSVLDYKVIHVCYQPIIENAVYHGLKYRDNMGVLRVRAYRKGNMICLSVEDNGVGMDESTLKKLQERLIHYSDFDEDGHVGLLNVQRRFKLMFGEQSNVTVKSTLQAGTVVEVCFPMML